MRVAICTPEFGSEPGQPVGGVAAATEWLIRGLLGVSPDIDIHVVVTPASNGGTQSGWGEFPVSLYRVRRNRVRTQLGILGASDVHGLLSHIRPDVVHVQGHASCIDGTKFPSVLTIHGIPEKDTLLRGGRFASLKSAFVGIRESGPRHRYAHLIAIANRVMEGVRKDCFKGVHAIPNAINTDFFISGEPQRSHLPVILQVGRVIRGKNVMGLVDAMAVLAREVPDVQLRVVGPEQDPEYAERVRLRVRELGLEKQVLWLGALGHEALFSELKQARVLALPSLQETAPICIAEAHAMGVPVVANDVGGVAEMIEHGVNGMLSRVGDIESLVSGLGAYVKDEEMARMHGKSGQHFAKRYHPEAVARATLEVYRRLLV